MTDITLNNTGTITFTNGSTNIVGVGTSLLGLLAGDLIFAPDGHWYEFAADLADNFNGVLDRNYAGTTTAASPGGTGWCILKASHGRDSVRTATKQLTDITSLYRQIINLTTSDQTTRLSKNTVTDRAGMILQKNGIDLLQAGTFADDDFSIRYLLASTWTKAMGVDSTTGGTKLYSQLLLGNIVTPVGITSTTNDYTPAGIAQANILRISSDATRTLTGIAGGADGRVLALFNVGTQEIDLEDEGGTSLAANRFALPTNTVVPAKSACLLIYDGTTSRWRLLSSSGSGSGGGGGTPGTKGWSPIMAYVSNGTGGYVAQIADWVGGEGTKPTTGAYIGPTGEVSTVGAAVSVLGPAGPGVQIRSNLSARTLEWSYAGSSAWQTLIGFDPLIGPPATLEWLFSTTTTDSDPGASTVSFNSATFGAITTLFFDKLERQGNDVSTYINTFDDSSSLPNRGILSFTDTLSPGIFATFLVTGAVITSGNYFKVPVTPITGSIPANGRRLTTLFTRTGDRGISGIVPRGAYDPAVSYNIGDVVNNDNSSYISLVQPNLNQAITPGGSNANWALFAYGVNAAFLTSIAGTLTSATTRATAAAASAVSAASHDTSAAAHDASASSYDTSAAAHDASAAAHETAAATSLATATTQAGVATTQAGTATTQAGIATTQAGIATTKADVATTQAGIATTKATAAASSASDSATSQGTSTTASVTASSAAAAALASANLAASYAAALATNSDYGFAGSTFDDSQDNGLVS